MIAKINHIGIAVKSLDERLRFWKALGLKPGETELLASEKVQVSFLPVGESSIELLEPTDGDSPVGRYIEKRGEGIHHIALQVTELDSLLGALEEAGFQVLHGGAQPGADGSRVGFLHPRSCGGVLVELVEEADRKDAPGTMAPGETVLAYLRDPQEKIWGVLRSLDASGIVLEGIDLGSFDDWISQVERGEESVVGPSVVFLPMSRIERVLLDRTSGDIPSLSERFFRRVGRSVLEVLGDCR
ncbi:MAG: methylmalonyl-CoA epimerase [Acidobacteria bacterium]|uniref:Methylmalonyl-CoA epimerase n=1 Tax=Candidatus Polarisedimenticola svalbardensis TaxID=2886004 RepID=A0A8J6XS04_9BACT|nr:methylmalonyl-CoA epimerase [Candidatus Polarisedimenticola svalbardensis]